MKRFFFLVLTIILINIISQAQQRPAQNIRRITVTNQYVLENGNKTAKFWAVYQEMYDSLGRLHTEIEYDFLTHQPIGFFWHTYNGTLQVKTQIFSNEKLQIIKEFVYNNDSLISKEIVTKVKPGDTSKYLTINYSYNKYKKPTLIEAKSGDGKVAFIAKYKYDTKGTEIKRKVKVKKGIIPSDSIIQMSCKPQYDSLGQLKSNLISVLKFGNKLLVQYYNYTYDSKGRIIVVTIKNAKGELVSRIEKIYDPNKPRIQQIKYFNHSNNIVKWLAFRYEIYRTNDLRFREIDY